MRYAVVMTINGAHDNRADKYVFGADYETNNLVDLKDTDMITSKREAEQILAECQEAAEENGDDNLRFFIQEIEEKRRYQYENGCNCEAHFVPSTRHTLATQYSKFDNGEVWQRCRVFNAVIHYDEIPAHVKELTLGGEKYYGNMNNGIAYKAI